MTTRQTNTRTMLQTTRAVLKRHEAIWKKRKPFAAAVNRLDEALDAMEQPLIAQGRDTTGIREDKDGLLLRAAEEADAVGDLLQAYALDTDNHTLYRDMQFSPSELVRLSDGDVEIKMRAVLQTAAGLARTLEAYGLEKHDLRDLEAAIEAFSDQQHAPRLAIGDRKAASGTVGALLRGALKEAYLMDKLIGSFSRTEPEFVAAYKSARITVDAGHGPRGDAGAGA